MTVQIAHLRLFWNKDLSTSQSIVWYTCSKWCSDLWTDVHLCALSGSQPSDLKKRRTAPAKTERTLSMAFFTRMPKVYQSDRSRLVSELTAFYRSPFVKQVHMCRVLQSSFVTLKRLPVYADICVSHFSLPLRFGNELVCLESRENCCTMQHVEHRYGCAHVCSHVHR